MNQYPWLDSFTNDPICLSLRHIQGFTENVIMYEIGMQLQQFSFKHLIFKYL